MKRLDGKDLLILQMYKDREENPSKPSPSIEEIRDSLPGITSVSTVHNRLENLEDMGLIIQPSKKMPRSRRITESGQMVLNAQYDRRI